MKRWARWLRGIGFGLLCLVLSACSGGDAQLKRGDELSKAGLYEEALEAYEQAAAGDPDDPTIAARLAATKKELAEAAEADGLHQLESGNAQGALLAFKQALTLVPGQPGYQQNLKKAALQRLAEGNKAIEQKHFPEAIAIFQDLASELPRLRQAKQGLKDAQLAWAEVLLREAGDYQERGLPGNALIDLVRIRQLIGSYADSAVREAQCRQRLERAANFGFAVRPAKVRRREVAGTAALVQRLQRLTLPDCSGRADGGSPRVLLTVAQEGVSFEQARQRTTGEQKYQSGTRPVDNPAFLETEEQIEKTRQRIEELEGTIDQDRKVLEQVRKAFADAGPDDDEASLRRRLQAAEQSLAGHRRELAEQQDQAVALRAKLSQTPRMLDEPVYDVHEYPIFEISRSARLRARLAARSDEGQVLIRSEVLQSGASTSDKTNPAEPRFGVKADPLDFPKSDEDLVDAARDAIATQVASRLTDLCQRWRGEILERARQARTGAALEAIEDYILYLFVAPGQPPADLVQFLKEQRDFTDIAALRSASAG